MTQKASDIHIISGSPVVIRRDSRLFTINNEQMTGDVVAQMIRTTLPEERYNLFWQQRDLDYSLSYSSLRLRANAYFEVQL